MQLTVEEALSIYPLSQAKLVAGRGGTARVMRSVNVMDAPDIADWTKSGEMLFTTAFLMKDAPDEAHFLLKKLNDRGCAGLGIKLGRFWNEIPGTLVEEAERLDFPLLELPFQFTFSDQMNALFNAEYARHTKMLHAVLEKQKRLMQYALKQDDHLNVFHILSGILGYPIAVVGARGHVLYNTTSSTDAQLLAGWPWKPVYYRGYGETAQTIRVPIGNGEECYGFLLVHAQGWSRNKAEEGLFVQAAEVLAYHMGVMHSSYMQHTVQNDLGSLVNQYLRKSIDAEELVQRSTEAGYTLLGESFQCVLAVSGERKAQAHSSKTLKQIRQELQFHSKSQTLKGQHVLTEDGLLSVYSCPDNQDRSAELARMMRKQFGDMLGAEGGGEARFYISRVKMKPDGLYEAYQECLETERLSVLLGIKELALPFESVELAYVFQHVPKQAMETYCRKILQPLLVKDEDYAQEMLRTLQAFVENDGQVNEAAKQLFIHRNTVTYRLEKMGDLLQIDFKKMNDLLKLKILFLFRQFM
ncbi:PucR family transcriptional regulator [Paenibacillus turpanensis]|uniref:PucR family transcriptional regulator n=1 Tax=Paenibacillus turpanensis TaxID=2689078 RepID=UPI00140E35CA|nr:PucR family transcriptional regulator [Paenibacillus turpanensis]